MKPTSIKAIVLAIAILCLVGTIFGSTILTLSSKSEYVSENKMVLKESELDIPSVTIAPTELTNLTKAEEKSSLVIAEGQSQEEIDKEAMEKMKNEIVYDGMTRDELAAKLNRSLNSTLSGQGYTFASYATELGVDPYLSVAIALHETGCKWTCSSLMRQCNNVGGMKGGGTGKCNGGSYASFPTLEEGIKAFMNNLNKNYFSQGLTTPEAIGPKYAASTTWATQVNTYINQIKAA